MIGIILDLSHLDWANYMDILTTSIFLAGMWLMAEKKVESWVVLDHRRSDMYPYDDL